MFLRPENVRVLYAPRLAFEAADVRVQTADFQRVDFAAIKRNTETLDAAARRQIANVMAAAVWKLIGDADRMRELLDQDVSDIAQVKIDAFDIGKLKAACRQALINAWELGAAQSRREIIKSSGHKYGRSTFAKKPTTLRDNAAAYLDANGMRMAQNLGDGARAMIQQELTRAVRTGISPTEAAAIILDRLASKGFTDREGIEGAGVTQDVLDEMEALDDIADVPAYINTLVRTNTFEAMNEARFAEFTDPELDGWVVAFEYSSILDESTTEFCRYMDGRVYAADNEVWDTHRPPNHFNCRSLLIPITKSSGWDGQESDPPEVDPATGFARCGCGKEHGLPRSVAVQHSESPNTDIAHDEGARSTFEYDESQHPRDENGRWTDGGGGGGVPADKLEASRISISNVSEDWRKVQIDSAEKDYDPSALGGRRAPGAITAEVEVPEFPLADLVNLPGLNDEQRLTNLLTDRKAQELEKTLTRDQPVRDPILIDVNHLGRAYIVEGNHRVARAAQIGLRRVPVHIRYKASGERKPGPFNIKNFATRKEG